MAALTEPSRDSHQPDKNYTRVRVIGDRKARDYEANEWQQIQDQRRQIGIESIFRHGAILREAGGTVGAARQGVATANITATSRGEFVGFETQLYSIVVLTGGAAGTAVLNVSVVGSDAGHTIETLASDPLDGTVFYPVGSLGAEVAFTKVASNFLAADSWLLPCAAERTTPTFSGNDITLPAIWVCVHGDIFHVPGAVLTYPPAVSGVDSVYVEVLTTVVNSGDDPNLLDPLSGDPVAERIQVQLAYRTTDTTGPAVLPAPDLKREAFVVYRWDRAEPELLVDGRRNPNAIRRAQEFSLRLALHDMPGQITGEQLARVELNRELEGDLAVREHEAWGSFVTDGFAVQQSTNAPPAGFVRITVDAGTAHVNGLRVVHPDAVEVDIAEAVETQAVLGEPITYDSAETDYPLGKSLAQLADGFPIAAVSQVLALNVPTTADNVTKGGLDGTDTIGSNVTRLVQVVDATVGGAGAQTINPQEQALLAAEFVAGFDTDLAVPAGDGAKFAQSGGGGPWTVVLSPDTPEEESVTYASVDPGAGPGGTDLLTGVVGAANTHPVGRAVVQENFRLAGSTGINWNSGGEEPDTGTTYDVLYERSLVLASGPAQDYQLVDADADGAKDTIRFDFTNNPTREPTDGSQMTVQYTFYLKRRDIVFLRQDGSIGVSTGIPAEIPGTVRPSGHFLALAEVNVPPKDSPVAARITEVQVLRVTVHQLNRALQDLDTIRHDLIEQRLLNQQIARDPNFLLVNADSFIDDSHIDRGFNKLGGQGGEDDGIAVVENAGLNVFAELATLNGGHLELPRTMEQLPLVLNLGLTPGGQTAVTPLRSWLCIPFAEVAAIAQDQATERRNINSFLAYSPAEPRIVIDPKEDFWIETTNAYGLVIRGVTFAVSQETWVEATQVGRLSNPIPGQRGRRVTFDQIIQQTDDVFAVYMRQLDIAVRGRFFASSQGSGEEVVCSFDGKSVFLTPIEGSAAGGTPGSVLAAPDTYNGVPQLVERGGHFAAMFTIPANVRTGQRLVKCVGSAGSIASAVFTSFGIERTVHNLTLNTVLRSPLAQTWAFREDTVLTSISVPFESVGAPADDPLIVELREVITPGGYPGPRFFEQVPRTGAAINVGFGLTNNFAFPDLVFQPAATFLAATFRNVGNGYHVWTATMGRGLLNPGLPEGATLDYNPNLRPDEADRRFSGVVLDSLNNDYWESPDPLAAGSTIALRYTLYRAEFSPVSPSAAYAYYSQLTFSSAVGYLFLACQQYLRDQTSVIWEISHDGKALGDGTKAWISIEPFRELRLEAPKVVFDVRARYLTTSARVSPFVHQGNATLVGMMPMEEGEYIEKPVTVSADVATATVSLECDLVEEADLTLYMSNGDDDGLGPAGVPVPIWELPASFVKTPLADGWEARTYTVTFDNITPPKPLPRKLRARIRLRAAQADLQATNRPSPRVRKFGYSTAE